MKSVKNILLAALVLGLFSVIACQKNSGGGGEPEEENLVVETTPTTLNSHVEAPAPGPDFPLQVKITSAMPAAGVKIDVIAKEENATTPFYSESKSGTAAQQNFIITATPKTTACIVEITVTSNSKPANIWSGSYRYSRK